MSYFNTMLSNIQQDGRWSDIRFKILPFQNNCFRFPEFLYDIVDESEYQRIEEKRLPLFIGSQFGIYPQPEKYFADKKEPILVGILNKSMLSGLVAGLKISTYENNQFNKLSFFSNLELNQNQMSREIIKSPQIEIAKELKEEIAAQSEAESQVVIHINYYTGSLSGLLRVWDNTYLECKKTGRRSKLLFSENIAIYPQWTQVDANLFHDFTLIFENLPKECKSFNLIENIPEEGGFLFKDIARNNSNVYHQDLR